ncbi:MAG: hypothetical protein ACKVVP_11110 [Chloroflexota bacterium]
MTGQIPVVADEAPPFSTPASLDETAGVPALQLGSRRSDSDSIKRYANDVSALAALQVPLLAPRTVLAVLRQRDGIAEAISESGAVTTDEFTWLLNADASLMDLAWTLERRLGQATLAEWRATRQPPAEAWWWRLDDLPERMISKPGWASVTLLALIVAFAFALQLALKLLSSGADYLGLFTAAVQSLLVLLVGSSFTEAGDRWARRAFRRLRIPPYRHHESKSLVAAGLALLLGIAVWNVSRLAAVYHDLGLAELGRGNLEAAVAQYDRALNLTEDGGVSLAPLQAGIENAALERALDALERQQVRAALVHTELAVRIHPESPRALHTRGSALEEAADHGAAIQQYQLALKANTEYVPAINNLSRLLLRERGDYARALELVQYGVSIINQTATIDATERDEALAALYKNRGWALHGLKLPSAAEVDLRENSRIKPTAAAPHCLLAQVMEETSRNELALGEWTKCLALEEDLAVEATWRGMARARVDFGSR